MTRASRIRGAVVAAASLAIVGLAVPLSPTSAEEGQQQEQAVTEQANPRCDAGQRDLARAGDRFAQGCLSDRQLAQLGQSEADLAPGQSASENMTLLANIPKNGAFAGEGAFSSDLAFQGKYAFAGNYNGFTVYDISDPRQPEAGQPGALPRLAERHLGLRRPAVPVAPTPRAATTPATAPPQPRAPRRPPGRA